jgi:hypothetical protein
VRVDNWAEHNEMCHNVRVRAIKVCAMKRVDGMTIWSEDGRRGQCTSSRCNLVSGCFLEGIDNGVVEGEVNCGT